MSLVSDRNTFCLEWDNQKEGEDVWIIRDFFFLTL